MKKKLFLLLCALLTMIGVQAQTDVTSTYITNPGFEGTFNRFFDINTDRGVEKPVGWSVEWYQNNSDKNGMTYDAVSMTQDEKTWNAKSGKSYFARMRWGNATLYLRQTLQNLRPGSYTLSFSATAHSAGASNKVQVSVANQTQTIADGVVENANGNWTDYNINFTVTASTPYATIEFKADRAGDLLKIGIDEFSLTYDGSSYYSTILTTAQALYDDNKDWAENGLSDFATAITTNSGKESVADKNAAIVALETAIATYKAANSTDMTSKINNPNFDSNISGWTCTGGDGNAFQRQTSAQRNFTGGFLEKWRNGWNGGYNQKNFDVNQTIASLPNGEYTIKAYIIAQMQGSKETLGDSYKDKKHGGPYYIDDNNGVWFYATSGSNSANTWANSFTDTFGDDGGGYLRSATVNVSNGSLTIGFKGIGSPNGGTQLGTYANWIACDTWTLSYFGFDPTTLLAQIASLQSEAESLLADEDYTNVVGVERTNLATASTLVPADEKKSTLESAISQIEGAIDAFTAAKTNYDAYAEIRGVAVALDITPGDAPSTAAEALTAAHTLNVAVYGATIAEGIFNVTEVYSPSWSDMSTSTGQHWSGDGSISYADNWNGGTASTSRTTAVTLPAGKYILMSAGRGSDNAVSTMSANGTTVTFASNNDIGIGINKSGAASFDSEDAAGFANKSGNPENSGTGWEWRYIPMTLAEETSVSVTQTIARPVAGAWGSFSDFRILMISTAADAEDYAALNSAISTAESHALGFEDAQYAPYNNINALTKLAFAKSINQEETNAKGVVAAATADLEAASWTANNGDVDAVFNGSFSSDIEGDWGLTGWTRTNGWGQQQTGLSGKYATAYYNQPGSLKYGDTGAYTMPLEASTIYKLSFAYHSHEESSNTGMTVSVLNDKNEGLASTEYQGNPSTTEWAEVTTFFTTGAAGNYLLTLANGGNTWMTGVSLVKVPNSVSATIGANGFATFASEYPLDMTIANMPDGVRAYTGSLSANVLSFTKLNQTVPAKTGVLLVSTDAMKGQTVNIPVVVSGDAVSDNAFVAGTGAELPEDDNNLYFALNKTKSDLTFGTFDQTQVVINTNKAYFTIAKNALSGARLVISFDEEDPTIISAIEAAEVEAGALKDGKYLIEGKIVIVKNGVKYGTNGQKLN